MRPAYTWLDGAVTAWSDSVLHVSTDCVLRGSNVFEGIRAYRSDDGGDLLLLRLDDHLDRLLGTSVKVMRMTVPFDRVTIRQGIFDLLRANDVREDTHIRVVAYFGEGKEAAFDPADIATGCFILALPRPQQPSLRTGVRACISPWRRISESAMPPRVKAGANYLNSRYAIADARVKGFDLPILLTSDGKVAEGAGQSIFLVRNATVITPRITDSILESITRDCVISLAGVSGIPVVEREVDPTELYIADEVFFAGTAAEVQPVVEVDGYVVGNGAMGPLTSRIQSAYLAIARGVGRDVNGWTESVYSRTSGSERDRRDSKHGSG